MQSKALPRILLVCTLIILSASACLSKTVYVKTTGLDTNDGLYWSTAKKTVSAGIAASVSGDEIWVAAGMYMERITLNAGVGLYGGFAGTETSRDDRDWKTNITILDGNQGGTVVTSPSGADSTTVIDGFTIRNGKSTSYGGGISCDSSSPTIANNTITACNAAFSGAGIYANSSSPVIAHNSITGNSGGGMSFSRSSSAITGNTVTGNAGGGIYCSYSSPTICGNTISANSSAGNGGGIYCSMSSAVIADNIIAGNTGNSGGGIFCYGNTPALAIVNNRISGNAAQTGGGVYCHGIDASSTIAGNTIAGNCSSRCGGIYLTAAASPRIINNTLTGNSTSSGNNALDEGGAISIHSSVPMIANNIIAFNSSGVYFTSFGSDTPVLKNNCVSNPDGYDYYGLSSGTGDISVDPQLISVEHGQAHIRPNSPCVDAGDDTAVAPGSVDTDGEPRIQGTHVDIGADECDGTVWTFTPITVRVSPSGNDANDGSTWPLAKKTVQAGINAVSPVGGEVWVAAGTYYENIILPAYVRMYGAFAGTEAFRDERNLKTNATVLDGRQAGTVVTVQSGTGVTASGIDGFTIRNGGTGIGAGIYCDTSSPVIANNTITRNTAINVNGGGIYCNRGSATIVNNVITGNSSYHGGGIYCDSASPRIANNTIVGNSDGIYCQWYSSPVIINNIIAFNSSGVLGHLGVLTLRNNCVYGNASYDYSRIAAGPGDISADPRLVAPEYGQVHIQPDSPCIDAGDDSAVPAYQIDIDGEARIQGSHVDMGADESDGGYWTYTPAVVRVSPIGNDANDGSTWPLAKRTVQAGINAASLAGGDVWVAAGAYNEGIILPAYAHLYGGFAGIESSRGERNWILNETFLSSGGVGNTIEARGGGRTNRVDGFTIRGLPSASAVNCVSSSPTIANNVIIGSTKGVGVNCAGSSSVIVNNHITGCAKTGVSASSSALKIAENTIRDNGYGIYCDRCSPTIVGNTISGSTTGGIHCTHDSSPLIERNTISGNGANRGGALCCYSSSSPTVTNNVMTGNLAYNYGGALYCDSSSPIVSNNTFVGNGTTVGSGGAIYCHSGSPMMFNNVVSFNSSGLYRRSGTLALNNNCVYGNTAFNYSGLSAGAGDISTDPLFVDPAGGNYRLRWYSPCIDMGTNAGAAPFDMDGYLRPVDGNADGLAVADMGAYEYQPIPVTIDVLPGDSSNRINVQPNRLISVAVINDGKLDLGAIVLGSILFGPGAAKEVHKRVHWEDANGDGVADLVLHFRCGDTGIEPADSTICLCGRLTSGEPFIGCAAITMIAK